jgi:hypothetical protein
MPTTNETIIRFSKGKLTKFLLFSVGIILLGLFVLLFSPSPSRTLLSLPVIVIILGAFVIVFGFLLGTLYVRQILKNGPGLIIDDTGFTDYSSGLAAGYIPWSDVRAIKTVSFPKYNQRSIAIVLKNPNAFLERQPNALKRKALTLNLRKYGSPIRINENSLQCSFDELLHHFQTYFDRSRPSVLN